MIFVDGVYRPEAKEEWQGKLQAYFDGDNPTMAINRVKDLAFRGSCWDWDDNVPEEWALELAEKWRLSA